MEFSYLLHQMCHEVLTPADINAIRKVRGFKEQETASRTTFESFFLSTIGVEAVLSTLTAEEVATLHLLSRQPEPVDISFFERLYGGSDTYYSPTFSQKFKETLAAVKKSLVRRGVLVMADAKQPLGAPQMERWRFCIPPDFARFLPPLIQAPRHFPDPGEQRLEAVRRKLLEVVGEPAAVTSALLAKDSRYDLSLVRGTLMIGDQPVDTKILAEWQQVAWEYAVVVQKQTPVILSPLISKAVLTILGTLAPQEWGTPEQLAPALRVFCSGAELLPVEKICTAGWEWGCLARRVENGQAFYRLPYVDQPGPADIDPFSYLAVATSGNALVVDLRTIPLEILEQLNRLACLEVKGQRLLAFPDPVKLGRLDPLERHSPLANWLRENAPAFQPVFAAVDQRWGKTILHSNLLVARVRDLSLRVQLKRELGDSLVVLDTEVVAFPPGCRGQVESILKKAGFVVKEVRA